ncbi:MAG: rRNA maturation RNase YbeY, partial [Lachnospiraceae bacterium]|nr:rRNA maturation RNase YbeY [Candidatus Equihabitans merdae]
DLNREMRGIDKVTDVLSFPMTEYATPADFDSLDQDDIDAFDPENGCLVLGDIVIAATKVQEQAEAYGHSNRREWAFLIAHSMLHLMGYDHMNDEERLVMEEKQERILQNLKIRRER